MLGVSDADRSDSAPASRAKQLWGAARDAHSPNANRSPSPDAWKEVTAGVKEARKTIRTGVKMPAPGRRASAMEAPSPASADPSPMMKASAAVRADAERRAEARREGERGREGEGEPRGQLWGAARDEHSPNVTSRRSRTYGKEGTKGVMRLGRRYGPASRCRRLDAARRGCAPRATTRRRRRRRARREEEVESARQAAVGSISREAAVGCGARRARAGRQAIRTGCLKGGDQRRKEARKTIRPV